VENLSMPFMRLILLLLASVATALSAPITLELSGGSVIKGGSGFLERATSSRESRIRLADLQARSVEPSYHSKAGTSFRRPQKLLARISDLEATGEEKQEEFWIQRARVSMPPS
jgi:hypothetical protein